MHVGSLKKLNDISTKNKLLISYFLTVFLPLAILGIFLTVSMRNMALGGAVREAVVNVDRVKKRITEVLKIPVDISNKLYVDRKLGYISSVQYENALDVVEAYWSYTEFEDYWKIYKSQIKDIRFYTPNDTILENWHFFKATDDIQQREWYKSAVDNKSRVTWHYVYSDYRISQTGYFLSLARLVLNEGKPAGVLVIEVDRNILNSILIQESFDTMIVNESGTIIAAKAPGIIGKKERELNLDIPNQPSSGTIFNITYKNKPSKAITDRIQMPGANGEFKIISVFPVDNILKPANRAGIFGFTIMGVSFVFSSILIFIFSSAMSRRIKRLNAEMDRVSLGDFEYTSKIDGKDEIGHLAKNLEKMVKSIKELIHEVYETNLQKNRLELKQKEIMLQMLANQINPHFLFNALETIRMKAICSGESEIAGTVKMLGSLLRRNLEASSDLIPLNTELNFVKDYLEIQRFRFEDKITYHINTVVNIESYYVLPLIIQPVAENAVIHGIEGLAGCGIISIETVKRDGKLVISVSDNGPGIGENKLKSIKEALDNHEENHAKRIGLRNVHQRIKLFYGDEYGLKIFSKLLEGTRVDICLPWRE